MRVVWVLLAVLGACGEGRGAGIFDCGFGSLWAAPPFRLLGFIGGAGALLDLGSAFPPGVATGAILGSLGLCSNKFTGTGRAPPAVKAP